MNERINAINKIIAECLMCQFDQISQDKHLIKDLLADSISYIDMITAICNHFDISISERELMDINKVQDIYSIVTYKCSK